MRKLRLILRLVNVRLIDVESRREAPCRAHPACCCCARNLGASGQVARATRWRGREGIPAHAAMHVGKRAWSRRCVLGHIATQHEELADGVSALRWLVLGSGNSPPPLPGPTQESVFRRPAIDAKRAAPAAHGQTPTQRTEVAPAAGFPQPPACISVATAEPEPDGADSEQGQVGRLVSHPL